MAKNRTPAEHPALVPLNLVYDYPVRWSRFKVLRDFVQNFYDAVPQQEWADRFAARIENQTLFLTAVDVGFSYDWLIPIGASTKREGSESYAGYFGEGFKIASLCAVRDHGWSVGLQSRNWELTVTTTEFKVDGRELTSLAYHIESSSAPSPDTVLSIAPFTDDDLLHRVLLSFYYPGNPLFGDLIWESAHAAVYFRSKEPKPTGYPSTFDESGPGIIFAGYQALGSLRYPLIFCLHHFRINDRERNSFFRMDVVKVIHQIVTRLPPEPSAVILRVLKNRWYDRPQNKYDFESWYSIIDTLVSNIATSPDHITAWRHTYPNLLVAPQVKRSDIPRYNRRRQALDWARASGRRFRLVQDAFIALGYPTLEQACEKDDGFSITRSPHSLETRRIHILEQLTYRLLPELFEHIELPPCRIIVSDRAAWQGMTTCIPIPNNKLKFRGIPIRFRLPYIALKESLLQADSFGNGLSTYLHELTHMFGGDRSASFSHMLSELMTITLANSHLIAAWEEQWRRCTDTIDDGDPLNP